MEAKYLVFESALVGKQIGVGATADVFAYGSDRIIKIFHTGADKGNVEHEFGASKAIEQTGLPVPYNYGICEIKDRNSRFCGCLAIVQERVAGTSVMKQVMIDEQSGKLVELVEQVVALQVRINSMDAQSLNLREQKPALRYSISIAPLLTDEEKGKLYALLEALPEGNKICHCDYHFDNIFITPKGLVCFDWCDAACGNSTADLARSLLIFKCEATPDSIPPQVQEQIKRLRDTSIPLYTGLYEKLGGRYDHLDAWMAVVAAGRLPWEVEANRQAMLRVVREYLTIV